MNHRISRRSFAGLASLTAVFGASYVWRRLRSRDEREDDSSDSTAAATGRKLSWQPLVASSEISSDASLGEHAHLVLALGGQTAILITRLERSTGVNTYMDWLLGPAASGRAGHAPWMVKQHGVWVPRLNSLVNAAGPGEAHPGQLLCYACLRRDVDAGSIVMLPSTGDSVTIETIVDGLASLTRADGDNDHLIPPILMLSRRTRWNRPYGDQISLDEIVATHLDAPLQGRSCFGAHWLGAVHAAACGPGRERLSKSVREKATLQRRLWAKRLLECFGSRGDVAGLSDQPSALPGDSRLSMVAHYLELLPLVVERQVLLASSEFWNAAEALAEEASSSRHHPLRIRAHVDHALRTVVGFRSGDLSPT